MYLITQKNTNIMIGYGEKLEHWSNGYPVLADEKLAFVSDTVEIYEVTEVEKQVVPLQYCYNPEMGFYLNPNWQEPTENPYGLTAEQVAEIEQDYRDRLAQEVRNDA